MSRNSEKLHNGGEGEYTGRVRDKEVKRVGLRVNALKRKDEKEGEGGREGKRERGRRS